MRLSVRNGLGSLLLLVLAAASISPAQSTLGDIAGSVSDLTGAAIPNAQVTLTNTDTGINTAIAAKDGTYRFPALPPGHYQIAAAAAGFASKTVTKLTLELDGHLQQDITLSVGSAGESVTVDGFSPQVNTESNTVGGVVTQDEIDKLPVNTRQYLNLALLVPGTSQDGSRSFYNNVQIGGGSGYYTNGFVVDGVSNVFAEMGEPRQNFPQGGVQEFKVNITQYPAEYGLSMGGLISVVTKSGTNRFHGEAFELFRNKFMNRPTPFQTTNPDFNRNQFGGDVGGPIFKDRTHFYAAFERTQTTEVYTVAANPTFYAANNGNFDKPSHDQFLTGRIDHQITDKQSMFVRYAQEWNLLSYQGCTGTNVRNCYNGQIPRQSLVVGHTWTISPSLLNEFRFQYAYASYQLGPPNAPIPSDPGSYSQQVLNSLQTAYVFPGFNYGFGYADTGVERRFQILNSVGFTRGKHNLRAGFDTSYIPYTDGTAVNYNGTWNFGSDFRFDPNDPATIAALRNPTTYTQTIPFISTKVPTTPLGIYGEDEWKLHPKLTLNLGLRWERQFGSFNERENLTPDQQTIPGIGNPKVRGDSNNFAPRLGLVWDPSGKARDVIRAGYGIYYNNIQTLQNLSEPRNLLSCSITIANPSYPNPFGAGKTALDYCAANRPNVAYMSQNFQNPYAQQYSAGYSRQVSSNLSLNVDGLYSYSIHDYRNVDINFRDRTSPAETARPFSSTTAPANNWAVITLRAPIAAAKYKALFVSLDKRLSHRYLYTVAYTLASTRDNNPQATYVTNPRNPNLDWGPGANDRRHSLVVSGAVQMPLGLVASGIWTLRSSLPLSVTQGGSNIPTSGACPTRNPNGTLTLPPSPYVNEISNIDGTAQFVPGTTRNQLNRDVSISAINAYIDTQNAYSTRCGLATFSHVSLSQVQNSSYDTFDFRLLESIKLGESRHLEIYGQGFNLFGRVNYTNSTIPTTVTSATFGRAAASSNLQQGELGARFTF